MTDYRSLEKLDVYRGEDQVGTLTRLPRGCEFRYDQAYLRTNELPIALNLPKTEEPLLAEGILNLPTYFAGLLPEGVMFAAAQTLIGSAKDDLFAVLAATGRDAVGDVEVRVPGSSSNSERSVMNLKSAREAIDAILARKGGRVEAISGIAGVQPKMSLGGIVKSSRDSNYIAKFPPIDYPGLPENEVGCMTLARRCGLRVPRARLEGGIYIVERFDRVKQNSSIKKIHVEDMLQVMNLFPNSKYGLDFVEICEAMQILGVSVAGILDTLTLYAFSYMIGNGDLHAKNVSLIRNEYGQWLLSPAYDLVSTLPYGHIIVGADAMAVALADESLGRFELTEFVEFGSRFGIPVRATTKRIRALAGSVQKFAGSLLSGAIPDNHLNTILSRAPSLVE